MTYLNPRFYNQRNPYVTARGTSARHITVPFAGVHIRMPRMLRGMYAVQPFGCRLVLTPAWDWRDHFHSNIHIDDYT